MIRNHYDGTGRKNSCLISLTDLQPDAHLGEQILEANALGRLLYTPVQIPHFADGSKLSSQAGKFSDTRQHFGLRRIRVQMV
jgi:hypothetical protein